MRRAAWTLLLALSAALVVGAALYERTADAPLVVGEATTLMQAASLAHDGDLTYTREDFDRLVLGWGGEPTDLALASVDGAPIVFDRAFPHALLLAPFVRLAPRGGFALLNALLLAAVAVFLAWTLAPHAGDAAPLWVALWVFASVVFAYVFLSLPTIFLFATTALGVGLAARAYPPPAAARPPAEVYGDDVAPPRRAGWLWTAAGAVLALPFAVAPATGLVPLALWLAAPVESRRAARRGLVTGFVVVVALQVAVQFLAGGGFLFAGVERFVFTPETGFPLVDFTAGEWSGTVRRLAATHWHEAPRLRFGFDPWLWAWDALYLAVGRNVGILPYFAPLLLLAFVGSLDRFRKALLVAVLVWLAARIVLHPFDLYGGPGAIAARTFVPLYGALLLVVARRRAGSVATLALALATALVAGAFVHPLWRAPVGPPVVDGAYRHVGEVARRWLPYETSQRWLPGGQIAEHAGLWVRFLDDGGWPETGRDRLMLAGDEVTRLHLVAPRAPRPLELLRLELGEAAPSQLEVTGGEVGERFLRPDGGIGFRVRLDDLPRRHAVWWSPLVHDHHVLTLRLPGAPGTPIPLRLVPETEVAR